MLALWVASEYAEVLSVDCMILSCSGSTTKQVTSMRCLICHKGMLPRLCSQIDQVYRKGKSSRCQLHQSMRSTHANRPMPS